MAASIAYPVKKVTVVATTPRRRSGAGRFLIWFIGGGEVVVVAGGKLPGRLERRANRLIGGLHHSDAICAQ
jgi:hypothetical protein